MHICIVASRPIPTLSRVSPTRAILSRNLRALIKKRGYRSVENFAYSNGLDKSGIYRILDKSISPTLEKLAKLAKALNVELKELYPGRKKP